MTRAGCALALAWTFGCEPSAPSRQEAAAQIRAHESAQQSGRYYYWLTAGKLPERCAPCAELARKCAPLGKLVEIGWLEARCAEGGGTLALTPRGAAAVASAERKEEAGDTTYLVHAADWELVAIDDVALLPDGKARARYRFRWKVTELAKPLAGAGVLGREVERERAGSHVFERRGGAWRLVPPAPASHD